MNNLEEISMKKVYEDNISRIKILGFVPNYVVWRRKGAAPTLSTLNEFSKRFKEVNNA